MRKDTLEDFAVLIQLFRGFAKNPFPCRRGCDRCLCDSCGRENVTVIAMDTGKVRKASKDHSLVVSICSVAITRAHFN